MDVPKEVPPCGNRAPILLNGVDLNQSCILPQGHIPWSWHRGPEVVPGIPGMRWSWDPPHDERLRLSDLIAEKAAQSPEFAEGVARANEEADAKDREPLRARIARRKFYFARLAVYVDIADLWVGVYASREHVYVCPVPTLVFRWRRRTPR